MKTHFFNKNRCIEQIKSVEGISVLLWGRGQRYVFIVCFYLKTMFDHHPSELPLGEHERHNVGILHIILKVVFVYKLVGTLPTRTVASRAAHMLADAIPICPVQFHSLSEQTVLFFAPRSEVFLPSGELFTFGYDLFIPLALVDVTGVLRVICKTVDTVIEKLTFQNFVCLLFVVGLCLEECFLVLGLKVRGAFKFVKYHLPITYFPIVISLAFYSQIT